MTPVSRFPRFFLPGSIALLLLGTGLLAARPQPPTGLSSPARQPGNVRFQRLPDGVKAHRDLSYIEKGHPRQKLDLYLPESRSPDAGPLPLLLWVHGGGWQAGNKSQCLPLRLGFVKRGFAVASIGYRLSGDAPFPAQIHDVKAAVRWLRAHAREYNLDPERFGAWGSSAGGHLVALLGTSGDVADLDRSDTPGVSSRVQAVCDFYGPTDLIKMVQTPGYTRHARPDSPESQLLGGPALENREMATRANPLTYVEKTDPPFLIIHGDRDPVVPLEQSRLLFEELKKAAVPVRFHTLEGAAHGGPGFSAPEIQEMVGAFFDRILRGKAGEKLPDRETAQLTSSKAARATRQPPRPGGNRERPSPEQITSRRDSDRDGFRTREESQSLPGEPSPASRVPFLKLDGENWSYHDGSGAAVTGILLKPTGKGPYPAVLISHGMGGSAGSFGRTKAREMVKWGYVCIAPDYTHTVRPGACGTAPGYTAASSHYGASPENLRRARACITILRQLPEVDASRLFAYGHSMGGFVTIGLAAAEPGLLRAAAVTGSGISPRPGYPAPDEAKARQIRSPFLILHGSRDPVVRPEQSASLKAVLEASKVPSERHLFAEEGHPIDNTRREEVFRRVREWFEKYAGEKSGGDKARTVNNGL